MYIRHFLFSLSTLMFLILSGTATADTGNSDPRTERMERKAMRKLKDADQFFSPWKHLGIVSIDSVKVQRHNEHLFIYFSPTLTHIPIRYPWLISLETHLKNQLGWRFRKYDISMMARDRELHEFIPNALRPEHLTADSSRIRIRPTHNEPLVKRITPVVFENGLSGNHIALWHSHGKYYNAVKDRWQWQRARLFTTVEDIYPTEYVLRYITPMLENAGAHVLLPRERDIQTHEVIVDNDASTGDSELIQLHGDAIWKSQEEGFQITDTLFNGDNPFYKGSHLKAPVNSGASLVYVPEIRETGDYAVYISWAKAEDNVPDVAATINYSGASASFSLNQQMGHSTWIYLGSFRFTKGKDASEGSLILYSHSAHDGHITADAVRFGGGMGNVARRPALQVLPNQKSIDDTGKSMSPQTLTTTQTGEIRWKTSQSPRFTEGARYYLQYAGMPDTLVYSFNEGKNDYNDDYMSRGEWVNYLMGAPLGPQRKRDVQGLNIPVDLSLAFHTDAGITPGDSVIGTLAIYSADRDEGIFPDSVSRLVSRDLSDLVQEQIVSDIRNLYNPSWTRRALWDRQYSEAWRPNVPSLLLELLSHQNLADMRFGLEPQFQFDVSRAIYKGIARFQAYQEGREAVIQPLPPQGMSMEKVGEKTIRLSWMPTHDPLEASAMPEAYIVYTREEGKGFDQGILTQEPFIEIELPQWNTIYSFKVSATNSGGESFPSEILSAAMVPGQAKMVLIVNGFQKTSGPGTLHGNDIEGVEWWDNHAIPYISSISYTGQQYDYDRNSPWLDDDSPGWGASYADYEGKEVAGNSFDYPYIHGTSVRNAGYSFISVSRKAFEENPLQTSDFHVINLIMGKQKGAAGLLDPDNIHYRVFTPSLIQRLKDYANSGGNIIITGAYIGTDSQLYKDTTAIDFTKRILGYSWRTGRATNTGDLQVTDATANMLPEELEFATTPNPEIYHVEAPDAIEAEGAGSRTVYRYRVGATSAAVFHTSAHRVFAMGIPFETITDAEQRDTLMERILKLFE